MWAARIACPGATGVLLLALVLASAKAVFSDSPRVETHMVPMRDGARLATDVQSPEGQGPWPVVLIRTPYDRKDSRVSALENHVLVVQDIRGLHDSEGETTFPCFIDDGWGERQDGLDTVRWVLEQPWCDGRVATDGGSALGFAQNLLAATNPPGVVCQSIRVAPGSLYHYGVYPGGVLREGLWIASLRGDAALEKSAALFLQHPCYDAFWESFDATARITALQVNIPALHTGGWFDLFAQGTLDSFVARSRIAPNQWLVMGPWPHSPQRQVGELVFPANSLAVPPTRGAVARPLAQRGAERAVGDASRPLLRDGRLR